MLKSSQDETSLLFAVQSWQNIPSFAASRNLSLEGVPSQNNYFSDAEVSKRFSFDQSGLALSTKQSLATCLPESEMEMAYLTQNPVKQPVLFIPGIDEPWPDDLAQATAFASEGMLSEVWNSAEEDEAWCDM